MGSSHAISREELPAILRRIHAHLADHRQEVDALNVFPVPDGDTGSNMTATAAAAVDSLDELDDVHTPEDRANAIARAALRGARGNSGVVLSQVLRALVESVTDHEELDVEGLASTLERARELSYAAIADPVEGTILTTITRGAVRARRAAREGSSLEAALDRVRGEVEAATEDTANMLAANRDAGVVDAGARGFALVIEALHDHVTGAERADPQPRRRIDRTSPVVGQRETGSFEYRFEVQYLLDAHESVVPELRQRLKELGDSVAVVGSVDLVSVHVHTNDVGAAIEAGLDHGRPSGISVVYFADQVSGTDEAPRAAVGCVAVLPAGALHEVATDHGVVPVAGASGELPSVDDLLRGVRRANADQVVLLPGHRNAIPTAKQAREVAREEDIAEVEVIEAAASVPAVIAALAVFHPDGDGVELLREAAEAVRTGEVVPAVRDAETPIGTVREGQFLTVVGDEVVAAADEPLVALDTLLSRIAPGELVTLIVGADVDEAEREQATVRVREAHGDVEVEVVDGGQRPARYLVGVE